MIGFIIFDTITKNLFNNKKENFIPDALYPKSTSCGKIGSMLHHILNNTLPFKTNGTFIEVGANDGKTGHLLLTLLKWAGMDSTLNQCQDYTSSVATIIKIIKMLKFSHGTGEKSMETTIVDTTRYQPSIKIFIKTYSKIPQFPRFLKKNSSHQIKIEKLDSILQQNKITSVTCS